MQADEDESMVDLVCGRGVPQPEVRITQYVLYNVTQVHTNNYRYCCISTSHNLYGATNDHCARTQNHNIE